MTDAQKALEAIEDSLNYLRDPLFDMHVPSAHLLKAIALLPLIRAALAPVADGEIEAIRERHDNDGPLFRTEMTPSERQKYTDRATLLAHVDRLSDELAQAKEALKPFAEFSLPRDFPQTDDRPVYQFNQTVLTLGDFRRAAIAAMEGKPKWERKK